MCRSLALRGHIKNVCVSREDLVLTASYSFRFLRIADCVLQVDVLETQYSLLVEKIKSTHDFETIKHAHSEFLSTLQSQLFFSLDPVSDNPLCEGMQLHSHRQMAVVCCCGYLS